MRQTGVSFNQYGSLSHDRGRSTEHISNPRLIGREVLAQDILFLHGRLYLEGLFVHSKELVLSGGIRFLPSSRTETKILGVLSPSVVSATLPNPYLPESHMPLIQMVACLGDAQSFHLLH